MKDSQNKLIKLIQKRGLKEASDFTGIQPIKLLRLTEMPIKAKNIADVFDSVLQDLLNIQSRYAECELIIEEDNSLTWVCDFRDEEKNMTYTTTSYANPYSKGFKVTVESSHVIVYDEEQQGMVDAYSKYIEDTYPAPIEFENVDEIIQWYKYDYLPETYEIIVKQLNQILGYLSK